MHFYLPLRGSDYMRNLMLTYDTTLTITTNQDARRTTRGIAKRFVQPRVLEGATIL
jgi:hypothetical protein